MSGYPPLKKPKNEPVEIEEKGMPEEEPENDVQMQEQINMEQEEALVALIEHRAKEVEHLRLRIEYYNSQYTEAKKRLEDTENKLARLRGRNLKASTNLSNGRNGVEVERSASPTKMTESSSKKQSMVHQRQDAVKSSGDNQNLNVTRTPSSSSHKNAEKPSGDYLNVTRAPSSSSHKNADSSANHTHSKPQLVIPAVTKLSKFTKTQESENRSKGGKASKVSSELENTENQPKGTKRKLEQTEHKDVIQLIGKSTTPAPIHCQTGCLQSSQHKRKLRSLVLCPTNDQLFLTSALDGVVNLWQVQGRGSSASLLSSSDCLSDKQRRWPEDIAWHPHGSKLFSVYSADNGDSQISILNLNSGKEKTRVSFLDAKPHAKGIINSILFMPWDDKTFVTGGSDHAVILWSDKGEDLWKPRTLHKNNHSSAVMGVAGMQHKNIVMSAGVDKRIIGFDVLTERADYKHQIDSKCMSVLPNPCDFNLFMVQTGTPGRQLRLFDLRLRQMEIHAFGWKQLSSDSQSALINQAWSPDGLYMTSGSADPVIHIFDIRYNAPKPSQSINAHQKRVFKAAWHHALPLLISISSDLNIGLHRII